MNSEPGSQAAGRMGRTALTAIASALLVHAAARWLTHDFQVWTAEGARRLEVALHPVSPPHVPVRGPGLPQRTLDELLAREGAVTIVDFMYTRCVTVCTALGGTFAQMQASMAEAERRSATAPVRLLSISFDPQHDVASVLRAYAEGLGADPDRWRFARVADAADAQRVLDAYGVTVIPDGLGGYEHNAALLVMDCSGRLVRIFDLAEWESALIRSGAGDAMRIGMNAWRGRARAQGIAGVLLFALLTLSPLRRPLESAMSLHMLVQFPGLMLAGALLSSMIPAGLRRSLSAWNELGIGGLAAFSLILAVLMIPRLLDLALVDPRVESAKVAALLLGGAMVRLSWLRAGTVVQGFFLGQTVPMTVIVGSLYEDAPVRLCNAYRLDDQQQLGRALMALAIAVALAWLARSALRGHAAAPK